MSKQPIRSISSEEILERLKELHPNDMYAYFKDGELSTYNQGRIVGRLEVIDQIEALLYEPDETKEEDQEDGKEQY